MHVYIIHILCFTVNLLSVMWTPKSASTTTPCKKWKLEKTCQTFTDKYNAIQKQLSLISGHDELLSGLLSKEKGQILRLAATLHILFSVDSPNDIPEAITEEAIKAAINFVQTCCEHASLIGGRDLDEATQSSDKGKGYPTCTFVS